MIETIGIWIGALFTLAIFSFLYKDNPVYKLAEHIFVGVSAGYGVALQYHNVIRPNLWDPLVDEKKLVLIIPFALGLMLFAKFIRNISWMRRLPIALMVGAYSGLAVIGYTQGDLFGQIRATIIPFFSVNSWKEFTASPGILSFLGILSNPLIVIGVISTLIFFFFSTEHKGVIGKTAKIGIYFLMISFGASFGYTVMARISLLIGRIQYLLGDWLHLIK